MAPVCLSLWLCLCLCLCLCLSVSLPPLSVSLPLPLMFACAVSKTRLHDGGHDCESTRALECDPREGTRVEQGPEWSQYVINAIGWHSVLSLSLSLARALCLSLSLSLSSLSLSARARYGWASYACWHQLQSISVSIFRACHSREQRTIQTHNDLPARDKTV